MSRLVIEIDPEQHRQIKTLATFSGMTIKEFILSRVLSPRVKDEEGQADATDTLLRSEKNAARLRQAIAEPAEKHVVFESMKDLEDALGI
ncbi:MAG: hypothetical protein KDN19_21625 [Verrucomicrobiae bacterium]|nr:hypothetical protein [Verrucomicrobiae bacterium]